MPFVPCSYQIPLASASIFSVLTYSWVNPIMTLGYQRTLETTDLWKLDQAHSSNILSNKFDEALTKRFQRAAGWNAALEKGLIEPGLLKRVSWSIKSAASGRNFRKKRIALENHWREIGGRKEASIALALNDTFGREFWIGGFFKVIGDTAQLMCPLLIKALITYTKERESDRIAGLPQTSLGTGIAMAFGLFLLTMCASIGTNQFYGRTMLTGMLARSALIRSIFRRALHITGKARTEITNSDLLNHISADVSRIDASAQWFVIWTAPIQILICLVILYNQLGPSSLAGFGLFLVITPIQVLFMKKQSKLRKTSMKFTDQRAKTLLEVLGSMRVVKYFSYEVPFLTSLYETRKRELHGIFNILMSQSANVALAFSIPVLASTLAFITYTETTPRFDVAAVFTALTLFQLLRQPMMFLPRGLSATADARNAFSRLRKVFTAEIRSEQNLVIDEGQEFAIQVDNATFEWEESPSRNGENFTPFRVESINMCIPRGCLVGIVGPVGSGKSSLLLGLVGEMKKITGSVTFGGRVAYCAQTAWIQNASVRDNILFGQPFDQDKYWRVLEQASLLHDLELLADGDMTEIGEKGINLSGGQKQRINVARALYYDADIVIMDDPLSALDAHVGKALFRSAIMGALRGQGKTVIFVTHALHFLSQCDYICTLRDGSIAAHGTYQQLIQGNEEFARLDKQFGGGESEQYEELDSKKTSTKDSEMKLTPVRRAGTGTSKGKLITDEHRTIGSIPLIVYKTWLKSGHGWWTGPLVILACILAQGCNLISSYTLIWWSNNTLHKGLAFYQVLYAVLGVVQTLSIFLVGCTTDIFSFLVSKNLHHDAIKHIFYAPMTFFDTTPAGRILGVFGKDIDSRNFLSLSFVLTIAIVIGSIVIISIVEHYFIIVAVFIALGYQYYANYHRASAREVKRLDSMLRSLLYSHFSESLTGLSTLRTYGETPRFLKENSYYIDLENRALILSVANQRWLSIRLDFCGALLTISVALFAISGGSGISAAQVGLVLTYISSLTQACGMLTRQTTEVENHMNSIERVVDYSRDDLINQEAPHEIPETKPGPQWPQRGAIEITDLSMRYRAGLPNVLHGISLSIRGGEKIGVVGRTGAGKSSVTQALLRIIEYNGSITIDGVDISRIGLRDLRTQVAIIPQDASHLYLPTIFSGTVRSALDPFSQYDDARLWDALRRSYLIKNTYVDEKGEFTSDKITLDTVIESEGSNLSVGQRSLLSLARALVRDTKIAVLDEATASVDLETDQKIQHTIATEFKDRTLICIAHRLRTILNYDRILVLDSGKVVEFDSPLTLFRRKDGIFRSLCQNSDITEQDIVYSK
ncbi:ABC protein [Gymnopilus junonius]|uniref:ABC protein n=1 Tax=Gymnopilus junonius TaxID=109634 RepID=A0A9P5TLX2_GYMJU|nr:ABC protein [Gymnopilus junonius]